MNHPPKGPVFAAARHATHSRLEFMTLPFVFLGLYLDYASRCRG
jgi:hypothetical protein